MCGCVASEGWCCVDRREAACIQLSHVVCRAIKPAFLDCPAGPDDDKSSSSSASDYSDDEDSEEDEGSDQEGGF